MSDTVIDDMSMIARRASLVAADVGNETVLMDLESGTMFQLNRTGARIWDLVETPRTLADLLAALAQRFPDGGAAMREDVVDFVGRMAASKLIELSPARDTASN